MEKYLNKYKTITFPLIILVIFFSVGINTLHSQGLESLYAEKDILVETSPKIPGPNTDVNLSLKSYSFNLNNYFIAWFLNGEKYSADYGNRDFSFKTGQSGEVSNVTAVIEIGGQIFRKELRFVPSEVDMLWEALESYTPPFYRGKALPLQQAKIRVTAIPETQLITPADAPKLIYYWDKNYKRDISASGFGKQSFTFNADPLVFNEKITVTSNDRRENSFAKNTINIPTKSFAPKILFYKINDSNRILTNSAVNTNNLIEGDTIKLSFHPLNFSTTKKNFIDIFVNWSINNESRTPQDFNKQDELYISSGGESGIIPIGVKLDGIKKLLQTTELNINLIFNVKE